MTAGKLGSLNQLENWSFVRRQDNKLYLDDRPFRFAGANIYWLGLDENVINVTTHSKIGYPTHFRVEDALATAANMGATVVRAHTLGISTGNPDVSLEGLKGSFNADAFRHIDFAIACARRYGLRLILPLTDNWNYYHGGKYDFVRWAVGNDDHESNCTSRNADIVKLIEQHRACPFYFDTGTIGLFKDYVRHLLQHRNSITGIQLMNDPTILAWETGNELVGVPPKWTALISRFIKHELSAKQLVMDGRDGVRMGFDDGHLLLEDIDIITDHHYPMQSELIAPHAEIAKKAHKAFIIGEFGWKDGDLDKFLQAIEENTNVAGDIYWSLFPHADSYGFVTHNDGHSLHFPGGTANSWTRVQSLRFHAFRMGAVPPLPHILPHRPLVRWTHEKYVAWRGAAGAQDYNVQRAEHQDGPWSTICDHCVTDFDLPWMDHTRDLSRRAWYRVQGINVDERVGTFSDAFLSEGGHQAPSSVPKAMKDLIRVVIVVAICLSLSIVCMICYKRCKTDSDFDAEAREVIIASSTASWVTHTDSDMSEASIKKSKEVELVQTHGSFTMPPQNTNLGGLGLGDNLNAAQASCACPQNAN